MKGEQGLRANYNPRRQNQGVFSSGCTPVLHNESADAQRVMKYSCVHPPMGVVVDNGEGGNTQIGGWWWCRTRRWLEHRALYWEWKPYKCHCYCCKMVQLSTPISYYINPLDVPWGTVWIRWKKRTFYTISYLQEFILRLDSAAADIFFLSLFLPSLLFWYDVSGVWLVHPWIDGYWFRYFLYFFFWKEDGQALDVRNMRLLLPQEYWGLVDFCFSSSSINPWLTTGGLLYNSSLGQHFR